MDGLFMKLYILSTLTSMPYAQDSTLPYEENANVCSKHPTGLNYTLPMFRMCKKQRNATGHVVQLIPKLIPDSDMKPRTCGKRSRLGIPPGYRICRQPDCLSDPCINGWCEETMTGHYCHCPAEFSGARCNAGISSTPTQSPIAMSTHTTPTHSQANLATIGRNESMSSPVTTDADATSAICPDGWRYSRNKCYLLLMGKKDWTSSKSACSQLSAIGGNEHQRRPSLLFIESGDEFNSFINLFPNHKKNAWLNCNDADTEGTWICESDATGTMSSYRNWKTNEPNNLLNEDCAALCLENRCLNRGQLETWNDRDCKALLSNICQVSL